MGLYLYKKNYSTYPMFCYVIYRQVQCNAQCEPTASDARRRRETSESPVRGLNYPGGPLARSFSLASEATDGSLGAAPTPVDASFVRVRYTRERGC